MVDRQILLDTETTGLDPKKGHKIIEIGCVELVDRRLTGKTYQQFLNPKRQIDEGALKVHGITEAFLADKPVFEDVFEEFLNFVKDAELIIHNAPFDIGFLNQEIHIANLNPNCQWQEMEQYCQILDTLTMARKMYPGQKNSLDALCKRFSIDNTHRTLHGALLDSEILADVYLAMTGGQTNLFQAESKTQNAQQNEYQQHKKTKSHLDLKVIRASELELTEHSKRLQQLKKSSSKGCLWTELENSQPSIPNTDSDQ